ncbi:MAG: S8 family peptidase [Candidatus Kariarchaeaceae archaeon]|jgi:serine protease AprX
MQKEGLSPRFTEVIIVGLITITLIGAIVEPIFDEQNMKSNPVSVGVVDSGCRYNMDYVVEYQTFTNKTYGYPSNEVTTYDTRDHGEHVCDLIHNYAPNANLYSARIADSNGILTFEGVFAAVKWLVEEKEVEIINLSIGSEPIFSEKLENALDNYTDNVIFIAAAGNTGSTSFDSNGLGDWPASLPSTIGVGAVSEFATDVGADYTAQGRTYFGPFVTGFSDSGKYGTKSGTSMSTPVVTGKVAELLGKLKSLGYSINTNNLLTILTYTTASWETNTFDDTIGWGVPQINKDIKKLLVPGVVIYGQNELEKHARFVAEKWTVQWKISSFMVDKIKIEDFNILGNGSSFVINKSIQDDNWGGLLSITLNATTPGMYEVSIGHTTGNTIAYKFFISGESIGKALLDHRFSINGYGHPYGEFTQMEMLLRDTGYEVNHALENGEIDLTRYDLAIIPKFYQKITETPLQFTRDISPELTDNYIEYIEGGGSIMVFMDFAENVNYQIGIPLLEHLNVNYTGNSIGSRLRATSISNFTNSPIFDGVTEVQFAGGEVISNNASVLEIGWYRDAIQDPVSTIYIYRSIGVEGSLGNGRFVVIGSTSMITNELLRDYNGYQVDGLIINFILGLDQL